jgi:hypothetical protein
MQQRLRPAAPPDRHDQRVGDDLRLISAFIDQPTMRRENRSRTTAT